MKRFTKYFSLIIVYCILLLIVACSDSATELNSNPIPLTGAPTVIGYTDYGRLTMSGTRIGTNTAAVAELRKQIGFSVVNDNPDFAFGVSYSTRVHNNVTSLSWIIPVTNVSADKTYCYIRLIKGEYKSAAGDVIKNDNDIFYANGSVGKLLVPPGNYYFQTNTCLGPGETGHFLNYLYDLTSATNLYDQIDNVVYENIFGDNVTNSALNATITPESYTSYAPSPAGTTDVVIDVKNTGTQTGRMIISQFLLLDDADQPLTWGWLASTGPNSGVITAGQKGKIGGSLFYDGVSHRILPYLDYEDYTERPVSNLANSRFDFATPEQYIQYLLSLRNEKQSLMRSSLKP